MSDTSLVFNLLGRDNISRVLGVVKSAFTNTGRTAETALDKAKVSTERLDRQIEETKRDLARLNREFAETGDKTLFGKMARDRSLLTQLQRVRDGFRKTNDEAGRSNFSGLVEAFSGIGSSIGDVAGKVGSFGSAVGSTVSPIFAVVSGLAAMSAAAAALAPALSLAGGALGAFATAGVGALAGGGALKLGLFGLSSEYDRLTKATGGGGGATKAAKDFTAANRAVEQAVEGVARAERDVRDAQQAALDAQKAINEARETAADRLRDQALDLKDAQLSQADAADAVTEAQGELNKALATGDPIQIKKARRAYDEAVIAAERAKNRVDDLTQANQENTKTGVEGSDEVVQAKKREQEARQRVADAIQAEHDAEERLADARKSLADQKNQPAAGGGGAAQQVTKLAPAARAFLNTILGLRPAMERLRLDVQQHLFAGLADKLQHLAAVWQGPATKTLTGWADTFNGIAKTVFSSVGKRSFIDNIGSAAESARKGLAPIGKAIGPLIDAFGRLARAGGPFLERIGALLGRVLEKFSGWIEKADQSGKLTSFFKQAADTLGKVWSIGEKTFGIVGKIIGIVWGQSSKAGSSALDAINNGLTGVSNWLDDPKNQKSVRDLFDGFLDFGRKIGKAANLMSSLGGIAGPTLTAIGNLIKTVNFPFTVMIRLLGSIRTGFRWLEVNGPKAWNAVKNSFTAAYNWVVSRGSALVGWVRALPGRIGKAAAGMWDGFKNAFRSALNWVIGKWNNLHFTMPSFLGGGTVGMPPVNYLAKGGIVPATPGGRLAVLGEGGHDEAVIPLPRRGSAMPAGGGVQEIRIKLDFGDSEMGRAMAHAVRTQPAVSAAIKKSLKVTVSS